MQGQWRILVDGVNVVAGVLDINNLQYKIEIAHNPIGGERVAQNVAHAIREFERTDRVGYMYHPHISLVLSMAPQIK